MPISSDNTRMSIDFEYQFVDTDGSQHDYQMRFQHSPLGPVIQISNGPYEPFEFPAAMFLEVAEFLVKQGVMAGMPAPKTTASPEVRLPGSFTKVSIPNIPRRAPAVAQPPIVQSTPSHRQPQAPVAPVVSMTQEPVDGDAVDGDAVEGEEQPQPVVPTELDPTIKERMARKAKDTSEKKVRKMDVKNG